MSSAVEVRVARCWGQHPSRRGHAEHRGGCTIARRTRRLPGQALNKFAVRLGLAEAIPLGHRLRYIVPGGRFEGRPTGTLRCRIKM